MNLPNTINVCMRCGKKSLTAMPYIISLKSKNDTPFEEKSSKYLHVCEDCYNECVSVVFKKEQPKDITVSKDIFKVFNEKFGASKFNPLWKKFCKFAQTGELQHCETTRPEGCAECIAEWLSMED